MSAVTVEAAVVSVGRAVLSKFVTRRNGSLRLAGSIVLLISVMNVGLRQRAIMPEVRWLNIRATSMVRAVFTNISIRW